MSLDLIDMSVAQKFSLVQQVYYALPLLSKSQWFYILVFDDTVITL